MSIGNLKTEGNKGNNFPWQLKMLMGQQCACDQLTLANQILQEIDDNTDTVEPLLAQILAAIQSGTDYEAALVVDANDVTWLEVRIWNTGTGTFDPPVYFQAGTNTPGTPLAPITYINPNTYLAQIVSNTTGLATETTLALIEAITTQMNFTGTDLDVSANMQVGGTDVSSANPVPVVLPVGAETPNYVEYTGILVATPTPAGAKSVSLFNEGPGRWQLSSDGINWVNFNEGQIVEWSASEGKTLNSIQFRKTDAGGRLILSYTI
jgi:hypothetical protein